jgi:hypothetical protein
MKLKRYWLNKPLLINIIKNNLLPVKITLILSIGFLLLSLVSFGALVFLYGVLFISAVVLTTVYAGIIQGYLSNKTESTYVKTLPLSTITVWFTQYVAGFLLISVTLIIQGVVLYIRLMFNNYNRIDFNIFSRFVFATIILVFIYYSISFFVVCISGKRIGQFIFSLAFYAMPLLFYIGIMQVGNTLVAGSVLRIDEETLSLFLPVLSGMMYLDGNRWSFFNLQIVVGVIFFIGSYFVYKYRPLENTEEIILYDGINYIIRCSIIITVTMILYLLISHTGTIFYSYNTKSLLYTGLLYCFIGIVFALGLELLFKSERIYRLLAMYLPLLAVSFIICIIVGQWNLSSAKAELKQANNIYMEATLIRDFEIQDFISIPITQDMYDTFLSFIKETPEESYSNVLSNGDFVTVTIGTQIWSEYYQYSTQVKLVEYHIKEETFKAFVNYNDSQFFGELLSFRYALESIDKNDVTYWIIDSTDESPYSVITNEDMEKLLNIAIQLEYQEEELFVNDYTNKRYWANKLYETIHGGFPDNTEINAIIEQPENLRRASVLHQANRTVEELFVNGVSTKVIKENFILEGQNLINSHRLEVLDFYRGSTVISDGEISFDVSMSLSHNADDDPESYYRVAFIFELEDGNIVSQKLIEKGEY